MSFNYNMGGQPGGQPGQSMNPVEERNRKLRRTLTIMKVVIVLMVLIAGIFLAFPGLLPGLGSTSRDLVTVLLMFLVIASVLVTWVYSIRVKKRIEQSGL